MMAASLAIDLNINPFHTTDDTSVDDCPVGNLSRISDENKKLKKMLTTVWDKYNSLQAHVKKLTHNKEVLVSNPKKRKLDESVEQSSCKRPNEELPKSGIRIVYVDIDPSDKSLVVKDGYQWRKYGQKVTSNNPSPRAYYTCSFASTCLVKKKVQRSVDDVGVVVVTYEGEHNHRSTMQEGTYALSSEYDIPSSERKFNSYKFDEILVKQMADSLGKDRNFTSELAASISTKILEVDLFRVC